MFQTRWAYLGIQANNSHTLYRVIVSQLEWRRCSEEKTHQLSLTFELVGVSRVGCK